VGIAQKRSICAFSDTHKKYHKDMLQTLTFDPAAIVFLQTKLGL